MIIMIMLLELMSYIAIFILSINLINITCNILWWAMTYSWLNYNNFVTEQDVSWNIIVTIIGMFVSWTVIKIINAP